MYIREFLARLQTDFISKASILLSGTVFSQVSLILASPVLTRLYGPSDFGEYALFTSLSGLVASISTGQYESAILLTKSKSESINLACVPIALATLVSFYLLLLTGFLKENYFYGLRTYTQFIQLLLIGTVVNSAYQSLYYLQLKDGHYKRISISKVLYSISNISCSIFLAFTDEIAHKLIFALLIGRTASLFFLLLSFLKNSLPIIGFIKPKKILKIIKQYKDFPMYSMPQALTDSFRDNALNMLISSTYGINTLGIYSLSQRILNIPLSFFSSSISQVFYQKASKASLESQPHLVSGLAQKVALFSCMGIALPILLCSAFFPLFFEKMFGSEWLDAGYIALVIAPWLLAKFVSSCISTMPIIFNRQKTFFLIAFVYNLLIPFVFLCVNKVSSHIITSLILVSIFGSSYLVFLVLWLLNLGRKNSSADTTV